MYLQTNVMKKTYERSGLHRKASADAIVRHLHTFVSFKCVLLPTFGKEFHESRTVFSGKGIKEYKHRMYV